MTVPCTRVLCSLTSVCLLVALALGVGSCGKSKRSQLFNENLRPVVTVSSVAVDTTQTQPDTWRATLAWTATDTDGAIARLEYAVDPTVDDTTWVATTTSPVAFTFPVRARNSQGYIEPEFRAVVLRVRDNRNEVSPVVAVALYAVNRAPLVTLVQPVPNALLAAMLPGSFSALWEGDDPDGYPSHAPKGYRVRLLLEGDPLFAQAQSTPDVVLREGETTEWQAWTLVDSAAGGKRFEGLANQQVGYLAVVAIDQNGAYTEHLTPGVNFQRFQVSDIGPILELSGASATYEYDPSTGFPSTIRLEVPVGKPVQLNWVARPRAGTYISTTRWRLDPVDLADSTDWVVSPGGFGYVILPALTLGLHRFMVEAIDSQQRRTLIAVNLDAVAPVAERAILVVDDTRREPDQRAPNGCTRLCTTPWPSAAELDTFLYARGGVEWRCLQNGTTANSEPGLFAGYDFDTTGTRLGLEDPSRSVTLSKLLRYRNVIWIVDSRSAQFSEAFDQGIFPVTALRTMCQPGHQNVLAEYVAAGGNLWLVGGGAALASLLPFDVRTNNSSSTVFFTASAGELSSSRMLSSLGHVQSGVGVANLSGVTIAPSPAARGGWTGHGMAGTLSAPDYSRLPLTLRPRDPATDPIPPTRLATQGGLFYPGVTELEYVSEPNDIREDMDPDPVVMRMESTVDTLLQASGLLVKGSPAPAMTYYHGRENGSVIFTGFSLWQWTRPDAQALVDFVLGDIWKLSRAGAPGVSGPALQARPGPARVIGTRRGVR